MHVSTIMEGYLKESKDYLTRLNDFKQVHVVLGNEACDLDSAVSSLLYGYLLFKLNPNPGIAVFSVLNVANKDFKLKTDVCYFLKENDISFDHLIFKDEVDLKALHTQGKLLVTLVDHDALSKSDKALSSSVIEIIDHHKASQENYGEKCKVTIELVGSCATLVAEKIRTLDPTLLDVQTATLLFGTILFDTVCLDDSARRVTNKDRDITQMLKAYIPDLHPQEIYDNIQRAKFDISDLSVADVLRKDIKIVSNSSINIAVSSVPLLVTDLISKTNNIEFELKTFNATNNYHTLVMMGIQIDQGTKEVHRDIGIYSINNVCKQQVAEYLAAVDSLQLVSKDTNIQCLSVYIQGNVTASRKIVLPLLTKFLIGENSHDALENHPMRQRLQDNFQKNRSSSNEENTENDAQDAGVVGSSLFMPPNGIVSSASNYFLGLGDPFSLPVSSHNSSNQNSCPYTPQNSYVDGDFETDPYDKQLLPSFNSREMMEKIETKRGKMRGYEGFDLPVENYPFTPKNSYVDSNFESYFRELPSIDSETLYQRVCETKAELEEFAEEDEREARRDTEVDRCGIAVTISTDFRDTDREDSMNRNEARHVGRKDEADLSELKHISQPILGESNARKSNIAGVQEELASPEDNNSFASSQGEKGEEKMDISTSGSDKDGGSPALVPVSHTPVTHSQMTDNNPTRTRFSSTTSTLSMDHNTETELDFNYQAETVDFPDSPRQMKLMTQRNTGEAKAQSVDDMLQDDDDVFRNMLSPEAEDCSRKERPSCLTKDQKKKIKVNPDILNAAEIDDDTRSFSSLSNKSDDFLSPVDDIATPVDIETPDDLEDSILERLGSFSEPIPELTAAEEFDEERSWRTCIIAGVQKRIDMKVIEPYKKVLSHGGYCFDSHNAIIVFSACYLPDRGRRDYDYVMDNLFLYVLTTLDQLVAEDYIIIYLHGATQKSNMPSFGWLKRCYQMIDRRLRKNLKGLYLVHPTFWLKTIVLMTRPFISSKFSRKLRFVANLQELAEIIPMDQVCIPDKVKQYDEEREAAASQP